MNARTFAAPLALAVLGSALSAGVIYVGPLGSGAPFQQIQPAIDAAQAGDVIVVLTTSPPAYYGAFTLSKPAFVVGESQFHGAATISGIPAGTTAGISNMKGYLKIEASAGTVIAQRVEAPVIVDDAARAWILDSKLTGMYGYTAGGFHTLPQPALSSTSSTVWVANSTLHGGDGGTCCPNDLGAPGIAVTDSTLYVARTQSFGGDSVVGFIGSAIPAGILAQRSAIKYVGGPGSLVMGGSSSSGGSPGAGMWLVSSSLAFLGADAHVSAGWVGPTPGPNAFHIDATSEAVQIPALFPTLAATPAVAQLGASITLAASGTPADLVYTFAAFQLGPDLAIPGIDGVAVLAPGAAFLLGTGVLDASGAHAIPLAVPNDTALLGLVAFVQTVELAAGSGGFSNPAFLPLVP